MNSDFNIAVHAVEAWLLADRNGIADFLKINRNKVPYNPENEINPNLASHGGFVSLVDIVDNTTVVLRFGGGCHGCGMVDVTLKEGIEKSLKSQLPEITAVIDVTDHSSGENPYYKHQCA